MKNFNKITVLLLSVILCVFSLFACTGGTSYSVNVENCENGRVTVSASKASEGKTVTVTATADEGYEVESILLDGEPLELNGNKATFKMPAKDVSVSASFKVASLSGQVKEEAPLIAVFEIEAVSVRTPGRGLWSFAFEKDCLKLQVWVEDAHRFTDKDGIKAYFGTVGYDRELTDKNFAFHMLANGNITTYKAINGTYQQEDVQGITAFVQEWIKQGESEVCGYKFTVNVPYELFGLQASEAKNSITMLPSHTNANSETIAPKESVLEGEYKIEKPNTYPVLIDDDSYQNNPLANRTAQLGAIASMNAGTYWDLEKDYFPEETNYESRSVILNGHDNADNNLFFFNTYGAKQMYAEATFTVKKVYSNEKYGKFGLMLFDGASKKGVLYYADAYIGEDVADVNNIKGTELGYNQGSNGWGAWNTIADSQGSFNLATKSITLKMTYVDGKLYFYCGDRFIMARNYTASSQAVIGIKSFGYGIEVTNYYATSDINDQKLKDHVPATTAREINLLFTGDGYMAGWSAYRNLNVEGGKANESIASSTVTSITEKAQGYKENYTPANIVISAGSTDIYSGATVQTVYSRIQTMVQTYHEVYPQAQIYLVSVIASPLHRAKQAQIAELNSLISNYLKTLDYAHYIDVQSAFEKDGVIRSNLFATNGSSLNSEFGYPIWGKVIGDALGITRANGNDMGDNAEGYAYSSGWVFESDGDLAVNQGSGEQVIWYKHTQYSADIYFEAYIRANQNTGEDAYPKAGLALRNDFFTIFAYADFADVKNGNTFMNIVYRPNSTDGAMATANWLWNNQGSGSYGSSMAEGFVKIAIAKLDGMVYMLCNDQIVATYAVPGVSTSDQFVVGALNFNRKMEIKDAYGMTDRNLIAQKLGVEIVPSVSLEDASALGGYGSKHETSNLTYTVSKYSKEIKVGASVEYARIYVEKTGAFIISLNGEEIKAVPVILSDNVYVYDIKGAVKQGANTIEIITADEYTQIKAKVVISDGSKEEIVKTDESWALQTSSYTLSSKPTYYFLGSSVTYGSANNGKSFVEEVQKTLGYNVVKEAVSGTTLVDNGSSSYVSRLKTLPTQSAVNRLIVQLSTNDVSQNLNFGTLSSSYELSAFNTSTVIGAIEYIIAYAKQTWGCEVIFYTNPNYSNNNYNALINELYKVQAKWGIGILDFYNYVDMPRLDVLTLNSYMSDPIHPNATGYAWMGKIFSSYIQGELEKDIARAVIA